MKGFIYKVSNTKKFIYYLVKCQFKLVFNDYQYCPYVTSKLSYKKTLFHGKT